MSRVVRSQTSVYTVRTDWVPPLFCGLLPECKLRSGPLVGAASDISLRPVFGVTLVSFSTVLFRRVSNGLVFLQRYVSISLQGPFLQHLLVVRARPSGFGFADAGMCTRRAVLVACSTTFAVGLRRIV